MPLQHYLPATYLANFSDDNDTIRRHRKLEVWDKQQGEFFTAPASKIAAINDLYTLIDLPEYEYIVDQEWTRYERGLLDAFERIIAKDISAYQWATILVPFVAGLFVRGPDFNERFRLRFHCIELSPSNDNINMARKIEHQRLLGEVAVSRWFLFAGSGKHKLITNDLGYTPSQNTHSGEITISIPIDQYHILTICPRPKGPLAVFQGGEWRPLISYDHISQDQEVNFNFSIAHNALRFIYGSSRTNIASLPINSIVKVRAPEPRELGFLSNEASMWNDMAWYKLISVLENPPPKEQAVITLDFLKNLPRT